MKHVIIVLMMAACGAVWAQDTIVFQKRASMPSVPKTESGYFVIDSSLFVIGGGDSIGNFYKEVWRYNIGSDSWHRMRDFVGGRISSPGAFAINGKGYICSGLDSQVNWNPWVWEYNPGSDIWTQKADFQGLPRQFPTCFTYNNLGYMHSGYPTRGTDLWKYDPIQDQWAEMDSLPSDGRFGNTVSVIDSFAYFFGGYYRYISGHSTAEVWRYNIPGNEWRRMSDIPGVPHADGIAWSIDTFTLYSFGLHQYDSLIEFPINKYLFSGSGNSWKSLVFQNFVDSAAGGFGFMLGNKGYYFGGIKSITPAYSYRNELWSFDATPLLTTDINDLSAIGKTLTFYPNPLSANAVLTLSSPEEGEVSFYNAVGQVIHTALFRAGNNPVRIKGLSAGVVFYRVVMRDGRSENGKLVVY